MLALALARITGWGMADIVSLSVEEAQDWLADAVETAQMFARYGEK